MREPLVRELRRIVGDHAVITSADRLLVYESDGLTAYRETPDAVVLPADTSQARRVLAALHREGLPVVPRGAGTGLSGGALAVEGGVVVGTARMNRILDLDPANRRARVQSGTINARLSRAAEPDGLYYAPDPSSQSACTLGGNVAENSGGPHCLKYGVTSRYITGLTLVLPQGEVVDLGPGAAGLDLVGVVVGSEGCFGLVTEIEVELLPLPEGVRTLLAVFDEIEDAGRAVTDIIGRGLLPAALEIVDRETIRAVESSVYAAGYPVDAGAALVVEFDGVDAGLDGDADAAEACCRQAGAREVRRARDDAERAALWKGRKKAFGAMGRVAPDLMVQDATVPRTRLPYVLGRIGEIARRYELTVANVFHAGDGNLHPNILFDRRNSDELHRVERASREMMEVCVEVGGTITGEHGVGIDKRRYMPLVHGPLELSAMADVKAVFDPAGRFNPGKVLPDGVGESAGVGDPGEARVGVARHGAGPSGAREPPALAGPGGPSPLGAGRRPSPDTVAARLEELLGRGVVAWDDRWGCPVVTPRDTAEVAAVLQSAAAAGWRVRPQGAGLRSPGAGGPGESGADGAHGADGRAGTPGVDVVLRTTALRAVPTYEPADLTLVAGAGASLAALDRRTAAEGQWLPLDPPGPAEATLGGVLATGLGGSLAGSFGRPRDLVLGLTCVTGDGRTLHLGGRVVKNVAGFDLVKLLVGSGGRLGVITEATVRLFPLPDVDRVLLARADRAEVLVPAVRAVATAPLSPAALELGEGLGDDGAAWMAVRLLGSGASVAEQERRVRDVMPELEPVEPEVGEDLLGRFRNVGCGPGFGVRARFLPARLEAVVEAVHDLERAAGAGSGERGSSRWGVHVARGILRWWVESGADSGRAGSWHEAWEGFRRTLAPEGGVSMVTGPPGSAAGAARRPPLPAGLVSGLEAGLVARFDPAAVLSEPGSAAARREAG